jgi:hypothetical protein
MAALSGDAALRHRMGNAGRELVASRFWLEHSVAAFGTIYETLGRAWRERVDRRPG